MSKAKERALAVLETDQIGRNFQFEKRIVDQVREEHALICKDEKLAALRGLRLGIVLYRVKQVLPHGKFMPFVKKAFKGYTHRTATDFMRVARHFVEKTRANVPEVLALANTQGDLALGDGAPERDLLKKANRYIGDKSLTQLIADAAKASHVEPASDSTPPPPAPPANLFGEQTEHVRLLKVTLHDPSALLLMTRQQREQIKDDLWSLYDGYRHLHEQAFGKK